MKSVLISIQPKWVEKIASGEKTIEVRKSVPKLERPFKCYIYCTIGNGVKGDYLVPSGIQCGKVIGEFVCDWTTDYTKDDFGGNAYFISDDDFEATCFTLFDELWEYGKGKTLYGWHISDLKIYDKPKELSEFCTVKEIGGYEEFKRIARPPQSWCYVDIGE